MSKLIRQQLPFLNVFVQTSSAQRRALLQTLSLSQFKVLREIAHNIVEGIIPLTLAEKFQLEQYRAFLQHLGDRHRFMERKRVLNKQDILFKLVNLALVYLYPDKRKKE